MIQTRTERSASPASVQFERLDVARLVGRGLQRRLELRRARRSRNALDDRRTLAAFARARQRAEQPREGGVRLHDAAGRSTVAIATGVLLKKRAKRTSAARWPSSTSSRASG